MITKKDLAIKLSKIRSFRVPKQKLEQYTTSSEVAAALCWNGYMLGDIKNKKIVDLCAGSGILGIGALLLGAKKVTFVEIDEELESIIKDNLDLFNIEDKKYKIIIEDARNIDLKCDTVLMNPPFGTIKKHIDFEILKNASRMANVIYSIHLATTEGYIDRKVNSLNLEITHKWKTRLLLKQTMPFHSKRVHYTDSIIYRFKKIYK